MKMRAWALASCVAGLLLSSGARAAPSCTAFVQVTVVSTDREHLDPDKTVVVRGSRIDAIGPSAKLKPPAHCRIVAGEGRYLIPGLADTHVHMIGYSKVGEGDRTIEDAVLRMLLANGVTTAVVMEGSPAILQLREDLKAGHITGPTLYSVGHLMQAAGTSELPGRPTFSTPDEARREVEEEKRLGYDFIKIHGAMSRETYAAILETAHRVGLRVVGHVPDNLGIDAALDGGQVMITHVESYLQTYFEFNRKLPTEPAEIDAMVRDIAHRTAQKGVYVQPTLSVFRQIIDQVADPAALLERPEMSLIPKAALSDWMPDRNPYLRNWTTANIPRFQSQYRVMQKLTAGLRDAGVPLLVGTDDMAPMQLPGFAMKDEMVQLEEAGLTPFEVLQAATATSARFLGRASDTGAVKVGFVADLVLLDANPMEDVSNVFRQTGVMLHGRWFDEAGLQHRLWAGARR